MKIVLTGGGTGGHFYPLIAVAESLRRHVDQEKIPDLSLYYFAPEPYDAQLLLRHQISFRQISAGKMRIYFSLANITDMIATIKGIIQACVALFFIYPDVVFSKGGYVAVPVLFAARLLRIPVVIHESDSYPGRTNLWSGKFAQRIAISYPEAQSFFSADKVAVTGQPVRESLIHAQHHGAYEYLELEKDVPMILVVGGSQGAQKINDVILQSLELLLPQYQIIHAVGQLHEQDIRERSAIILEKNEYRSRYHIFASLDSLALSMAGGSASLVITRAGSMLFEIASWGVPSIIIPIEHSHHDHQRNNAFSYARQGAGSVIEEPNLTPHVLVAEIQRIINTSELHATMSTNAKNFFVPHASSLIAKEIITLALEHEK